MKHAMMILAAAAGIFSARSEAATDYYRFHGSSCHSTMPGLTGEVIQHGVGNGSSSQAMIVACPFTVPERNYTRGYISFGGYDRSGNDNLSCTLHFTDNTGNSYRSTTSSTSGADNNNHKFGNGVTVTPIGSPRIPWVTCRIPPTYNGGWMSVLTSVFVTLDY